MTERKIRTGTQAGGRGLLVTETRTRRKRVYKNLTHFCASVECAQRNALVKAALMFTPVC